MGCDFYVFTELIVKYNENTTNTNIFLPFTQYYYLATDKNNKHYDSIRSLRMKSLKMSELIFQDGQWCIQDQKRIANYTEKLKKQNMDMDISQVKTIHWHQYTKEWEQFGYPP